MNFHDRPHHMRLPDFESYDEIRLYVVPRFKTSGLSGDEWRQHVQVDFFFKGVKTFEFGCRDMNAAAMLLGARMLESYDHGISDEAIKLEESGVCDQPSCREKSVGRLLIKQRFVRGEKLDESDSTLKWYRQFCAKHIKRGDCSREDCDSNYAPLDGVGADASTNKEESPSSVMMPDGTIIDPPKPDADS
jgi:hypothetical protein